MINGWQCGDGKLRNERLVPASGFLVGRITMIVYGETGGEIGMYACNVLRATLQRQDG